MTNMIDQRLNSKLAQQQQQIQAEMQMQNTVNELRGTYKMSDNDINSFLQFTTQPKERVGLNNLVKLWQMQNGQSVANNDTMEAVTAAKQAPRTAGVLQGQPQTSQRNDADRMFDSIISTGGSGRLP
jgi:Xaa-Pro aminopeptidase